MFFHRKYILVADTQCLCGRRTVPLWHTHSARCAGGRVRKYSGATPSQFPPHTHTHTHTPGTATPRCGGIISHPLLTEGKGYLWRIDPAALGISRQTDQCNLSLKAAPQPPGGNPRGSYGAPREAQARQSQMAFLTGAFFVRPHNSLRNLSTVFFKGRYLNLNMKGKYLFVIKGNI